MEKFPAWKEIKIFLPGRIPVKPLNYATACQNRAKLVAMLGTYLYLYAQPHQLHQLINHDVRAMLISSVG